MRRENTFYTKYSLTGGNADCTFNYGRNGDLVLSGDWDADGKDTLAVRRGSTYYIKNTLASGIADSSSIYGHAEDRTFAGDWNGDGHDALAVRRGGTFYVKKIPLLVVLLTRYSVMAKRVILFSLVIRMATAKILLWCDDS